MSEASGERPTQAIDAVGPTGPPIILDYPISPTKIGPPSFFREILFIGAMSAIALNIGLVCLSIQAVYRSTEPYRDLSLNSKAYGREIAPATIASLKFPYWHWAAFGAHVVAATLCMALALHLVVATVIFNRHAENAIARLRRYQQWKPYAAVFLAVTYFWAGTVELELWVAATRHMPIGDGPPIFSAAALAAAALFPCWWIEKGIGRRSTVRSPAP